MDLIIPYRWLLGLTLVVWAALIVLDAPLRNDAAPLGIVSLELAGTGESATHILDSWSQQQRLYAAVSLGLDYLFLVLYPLAISQPCRHLANTTGRDETKVGLILARIQLLAGPLDAIENAALILELFAFPNMNQYASIAWWMAVPKLLIIGVGLLYLVIGFSKASCASAPQRNDLHWERKGN